MTDAPFDPGRDLDRRVFLKGLAGLTAGLMVGHDLSFAETTSDALGPVLPMRRLGRSDLKVTMLGLGGAHFGYRRGAEARRVADAAIEQGVRFIDTAESYDHGGSERSIGRLLTPKYRDHLVYMTKTRARDARTARRDLDGSLRRLNTDRLDIWQMHDIKDPDDVDRRLDNGVLDVMLEARENGKVKYLGFTGHTRPEAHVHMLKRLDERGTRLDTVQMPVNVVDPSFMSFVKQVLPEAHRQGYGILAMKTLAYGRLLGGRAGWGRYDSMRPDGAIVPEVMSLDEALSFVWSLPVSCLISGTDNREQLEQNAGIARAFTHITESRRDELIEAAATHAGHAVEFYKA